MKISDREFGNFAAGVLPENLRPPVMERYAPGDLFRTRNVAGAALEYPRCRGNIETYSTWQHGGYHYLSATFADNSTWRYVANCGSWRTQDN